MCKSCHFCSVLTQALKMLNFSVSLTWQASVYMCSVLLFELCSRAFYKHEAKTCICPAEISHRDRHQERQKGCVPTTDLQNQFTKERACISKTVLQIRWVCILSNQTAPDVVSQDDKVSTNEMAPLAHLCMCSWAWEILAGTEPWCAPGDCPGVDCQQDRHDGV